VDRHALERSLPVGVADVETVDGVTIIHVRASAEGARLKTVAAERRVPVHPELVRLGSSPTSRSIGRRARRAYSLSCHGVGGTFADPFSKWFGRFLTKAKVTAAGAVFHSFRHGWRDRMREAGIPKEVADPWAAGSHGEGSAYGSGYRVATLAEHVAKISYPGLDLSGLYASPRTRSRPRRRVETDQAG